ncbi:type II secretion system F family protein [Geofilum rubicundum]|uniref:Type IV fimbrial assembly protein PilC n=1 Tax=Geofilum rubicundum JCM 15548 TaxID=1236989 RepID=A0A0E9M2J0_9BACT|nr:type II secretion system F family protein [Geofilum rubicundum]GAO31957.1 type IV fimbrial assembly protein PilC [Geofilum rubicundum JCM 15548]
MAIDLSKIQSKSNGENVRRTVTKTDEQPFWKRDFTFGNIMTSSVKEAFYSELVILITAGLDLKASLDIIVREQKSLKIKKIISGVSEALVRGATFSEALKINSEFTVYEYFSIKIGEESGRLPEVLEELSRYYQKKMKQRKQMVNAFSYPLVILATALAAVFFMMNFIVPLFADAFLRFDSELPQLTLMVIALSESLQKYWFLLPFFIIVLYTVYVMVHTKTWYRKGMSGLMFKIPLVGPLLLKIYLARFCQAMALMTGARTPLVQALELVSQMMGLYSFETALTKIQEDIHRGKTLNEAMTKFAIFEPRLVALVKVGEDTNNLDTVFKRLYDQYNEESDHRTAMLSSMLEPLMIVLIGGLVAVILIAMYLPMFRLSNTLMGS